MSCECDCSVRVWLCGVQHVIGPDDDGRLNLTLDPVVVDYVGDFPLAADAVPYVDPLDPGVLQVTKYARNDVGRVTHVAVCGTWLPVSSPTSVLDPGPTADHVCYQFGSWGFPQPFSAGNGEWTVAGADRMASDTCANQPYSLCIGDAQRADNYGSAYGSPVPDLSAAPWYSYPTAEGCGGAIRSDLTAPARDQRDSVRLLPDYPVGFIHDGGTVTFTFYFPRKAGSVGVALWDTVRDEIMDVGGHTKPSGASAIQHGDHLQMDTGVGTPVGNWSVTFSIDVLTDLTDCEIAVWAINNGNAPSEDLEQLRLNVNGSTGGPCFQWDDLQDLADWMNTRDPFGNVWGVDGVTICSDMTVGQGALYGQLAGDVNVRPGPVIT